MLYKSLDFDIPKFAHIPLILNPAGGKLSKRHAHTSVDFYMKKDFSPEALVNYIALLGWRPPENDALEGKPELFTMKELTELFSLERITASNAKLDENKLIYFNSHYMKQFYSEVDRKPVSRVQEFREKLLKYMPEHEEEIEAYSEDRLKELIKITIDRIKLYEDLRQFEYFFKMPDYDSDKNLKSRVRVMADKEKATKILNDVSASLKNIPEKDFKVDTLGKVLGEYHFRNKSSLSHEDIYHLLRFVLTGNHSGGPVTKTAEILGKKNTLKRIEVWL